MNCEENSKNKSKINIIHHISLDTIEYILELSKINVSKNRISEILKIPLETITTILWLQNSAYLENTKNFLFSHMFYIDLINDNNQFDTRCALCEYSDKLETCKLLCSSILKIDPNTPFEMLQTAIAANLKTSISLESLIDIIDQLKIQITYNLKSSKCELQLEPYYSQFGNSSLKQLKIKKFSSENAIIINIIKMKVHSRCRLSLNIQDQIINSNNLHKNYSLCFHNFYILIAMTSKSLEHFEIRCHGGFNSDDIVNVLNEIFIKYKDESHNKLIVMGPGIEWEAKYISNMTKLCYNHSNTNKIYKQTGNFCGTFQNLIKKNNFNEICGVHLTKDYIKPINKLMILFEKYLNKEFVCSHSFVNDLIISKFEYFISNVDLNDLYKHNSINLEPIPIHELYN